MDYRRDKRFTPLNTLLVELDGSSKGFIINVSRGGLCLQSDKSLITDSIHEVKLVSDDAISDSIACIVIWSYQDRTGSIKNSRFQYLNGLKYMGLNKKIKSSLNKCLDKIFSEGTS